MSDDRGEAEFVIPSSGFVRDAVVPILCCVLLGVVLLGGPIAVATGHMELGAIQNDGPDLRDTGIQWASAISGVFLLGMAVRLCYQGLAYGEKPFVFDRRTGLFRLGDKPLCRLGNIHEVRLIELRGEEASCYRLALILTNGRRVNFGPFLAFSREGAESRKAQIEVFLGLPRWSDRRHEKGGNGR